MPNLVDIVEIAESLETKNVFVAADRCVVVRNRNAKCRKCQEACPSGAFTIKGNTLELDNKACVSCGACTVVCPAEALIPLRPLDEELAQSITEACIKAEGEAVLACARIASKRLADPEKYAEVPCLARVEESVLVELAAQGITKILLVDGVCRTCKYRSCNEGIDATAASVNTLLGSMGSQVLVERASSFPDALAIQDASGLYGVSRRGFFSQTRGRAKDAAGKTVATMLSKGKEGKVANLRERLGISASGTLPQFEPERRMHILDSMDRIGEPQVPTMETRLWGNVTVDTESCNACGMCTVFCPTGALKKIEEEADGKKLVSLEFSLADCVQCNVCSDICLKRCLRVDTEIPLAELFDFEPRIIRLPEPPSRKNMINNVKR